MKIHIIGCSGSGKTYFAEKLSQKLSIPCFDLDDIHWDNTANNYDVKMQTDKRNALLQEILRNDNWIIEGVYYGWVGDCFRDADIIYVLETPRIVYRYRILKRFIKRKLRLEKGKNETLKSIYSLIRWTDIWQKENLPKINNILQVYENKVIRLKNSREVDRIISD